MFSPEVNHRLVTKRDDAENDRPTHIGNFDKMGQAR
jgi:hypothetical protein